MRTYLLLALLCLFTGFAHAEDPAADAALADAMPLEAPAAGAPAAPPVRTAPEGVTQANLHVYLLIGQSNMAGRAPIPADMTAELTGVYLLDGEDAWSPASNPLNRFSTVRKGLGMQKLGPGYSFSTAMLAGAEEGVAIGLVVNALGGSKIEQWAKGQRCYDEAVRRARIAQATGTLKGILWHQGESNNSDPAYLPKLTKLVADLRADLDAPALPVVVGQIHRDSPVNAQLAALPETVPGTACVPVEGLPMQSDNLHFGTEAALELGKRYAAAMLTLQHPTPADAPAVPTAPLSADAEPAAQP